MFTTPLRSFITPHKAPRAIGAAISVKYSVTRPGCVAGAISQLQEFAQRKFEKSEIDED